MEATDPSPLFVIGAVLWFCIVFPAIWSAVCFLMAALGGWRDLAGRFRTDDPPPPGAEIVGTARLGWANYSGAMRLGRLEDSLHMSVLGIFRVGHPHVRIPMEAIRVEEKGGFLGKRVTLYIGSSAELTLRAKDWERVQS